MLSDPVEIHLTYLRSGVEEVKAALPVLRDKIDRLASTVDAKIDKTNDRIDSMSLTVNNRIDQLISAVNGKIDQQNSALSGRIDAQGSALSEKIDAQGSALSEKIDAQGSALSGKIEAQGSRIDRLAEKLENVASGLADVRGVQKAMFWVLGSASTVAALASLVQAARSFNWI